MLPAKSATVTICLALLMGMLLPACDNKTDSSKSVAEKPSGSWEGKFETVIGSWDDLQKIVKSHKGKVVVIDMWSRWCDSCKKELPGLALLQKKYGDKIVCIAVNLDCNGDAEFDPKTNQSIVEKLLRERFGTAILKKDVLDDSFRLFLSNQIDEKFYIAGDMDSVPTIFVYDKEGKSMKFDANSAANDELSYKTDVDPVVEKLLK